MDLSLFSHFSVVFVFLLIFVVIYGFLLSSNLFKGIDGSKGIYAIIALAVSFLITLSKDAFTVITKITPWFTVLIIFIFLIFVVLKMFMGSDTDAISSLMDNPGVYWILLIVFILILVISLASTFGQRSLEGPDSEQIPEEGMVLYEPTNELIMVDATGQAYPEDRMDLIDADGIGSTATDDYSTNLLNTLVNPKVLGAIALLLISFFTIIFIAKSSTPAR